MRKSFLVVLATFGASLALHCSADPVDCVEAKTCADPNTPDGGGADVAVPEGCDVNADPKDAPKCVVNTFGMFVDATNGNDANPGTRESPMKTINGALAKAKGKPRVYICEGTYPEHVKLTTATSLYGGFACGAWTPSSANAKVAPADVGYALEVDGAKDITVGGIDFEALPGTAAARSSIAVFARNAKARFVGVSLTAKDGVNGASATAGSNYDASLLPDDAKLLGKQATGTNGGAEQTCDMLCTNGEHSTGGKGGNGGTTPTAGTAGKPDRAAGFGGAANAGCLTVGAGGLGGLGNPGLTGNDAQPAATFGRLTAEGWLPSDGAAGTHGGPGQGGGGGGGSTSASNGAGGGGGCGGCGGAPGGASGGGGASVALLSFNSAITLSRALLRSGKAGDGGAGAAGQSGQNGGAAGNPSPIGCIGGAGGKGGTGGASAGGAGGVSAGILFKGDKPTTEAVTTTVGAAGAKGAGGTTTNAGPDGQSVEVLEVQ